jgi:hypothetical protein
VHAHGSGRDRWRGGGVYLDGQPVGMLRFAELPPALAPRWETQRQRLPFKPGEEVRYREFQVRRYRVADYLRAIGVPVAQVREVHLHGSRNAAIVLTRADLEKHPDDILFKFAGETFGKPIPIIRNVDVGTSFDDLSALTIYVERTPPRLTADQTLELDGHQVHGIPYHGEPLREGVRVYVDDRLATMLKRNELAATSRWQLTDVLARRGVDVTHLDKIALIHDEQRTPTRDWKDVEVMFNEGASGELRVGDDVANAIALYSR